MADPTTPALSGAHWRDLVLDGRRVDTPLEAAITDAGLTRTMEGASTLTVSVHDQFMDLSRTLFRHAARVELDGLEFRLVAPNWQGGILGLTFEDEQVARLRAFDSPKSARRDHVTRARFIKSLFDEAGVPFFCPVLDKPQPVEKASQRPSQTTKDRRREPGFADHASFTVKGAKATAAQKRVAERILDTARRENAGPRATLALVAAAIVECELKNVQGKGADAVSYGVIQAIPGTSGRIGGGTFTKAQALDVEFSARSALHYSCTGFENTKQGGGGLIGVARRHPDWTIGRVAAVVINGAVNNGQGAPGYVAAVNGRHDEAQKIIDAYGGGSASEAGDKAYVFRRGQDGKREDSWTCARRLAEEVNWRLFMIAGRGIYMPDDMLIRSRPRMLVTPRTPGFEIQDVNVDSGRRAQELTLTCRAELWAAPPGTVAEVDETGPADGRWLVREIRRDSLASPQTEITLSRRQAWKPEPRAQDNSSAGGAGAGGASNDLPSDSKVMKAYRRAKQIDARHLPYAWGGGHGTLGQASGSPAGFDCSGAVSAVLGAAGLVSKPLATPDLKNWGQAGEGKYLTVWVRETGDPHRSHTFIEFKLPGQAARIFEFGGQESGIAGGFHDTRSKSGFTARHWQGT